MPQAGAQETATPAAIGAGMTDKPKTWRSWPLVALFALGCVIEWAGVSLKEWTGTILKERWFPKEGS